MSGDRWIRAAGLSRSAAQVVRGLLAVEPVRITRLRPGVMNQKYVVETAGGDLCIVRFYSGENASAVNYEPDLVRRLGSQGLPVAPVLGDSRTGPAAPLPYMAYEMIPGTALGGRLRFMDGTARRRVAGQLADLLASLQDVSIQGHGELLDAGAAHFETWQQFMETSFSKGIEAARHHRSLPDELVRNLDRIRNALEQFHGPPKSGVAWGDILTSNILVDAEDQLKGIVDFEGTLACEDTLNLGYCRAAYGRSARFCRDLDDAWATHGHIQDPDRVDLYAVLRGVRVTQFAHLPLPAGRKRRPVHLAFPGFGPAARRLARRLSGLGNTQVLPRKGRIRT